MDNDDACVLCEGALHTEKVCTLCYAQVEVGEEAESREMYHQRTKSARSYVNREQLMRDVRKKVREVTSRTRCATNLYRAVEHIIQEHNSGVSL